MLITADILTKLHGKSHPPGLWPIDVPSPLVIVDKATRKQVQPRSLTGKTTLLTKAGTLYAFTWDGGKRYAEVRAGRATRWGICTEHGVNKRIALDAAITAQLPAFHFVSTDWSKSAGRLVTSDAMVAELRYQRGCNRWGFLLGRFLGGWPMPFHLLTVPQVESWASWALKNYMPLVDAAEGSNEPRGRPYNSDPQRGTQAGFDRVCTLWNAAAKILAQSGKPIAPPSFVMPADCIAAAQACTHCTAVSGHYIHNWSKADRAKFYDVAGDRPIYISELGNQAKGVDQARANDRVVETLDGEIDVGLFYTNRVPDDVQERDALFMSVHTRAGQRRPGMGEWFDRTLITRAKPFREQAAAAVSNP